MVSPQFRRWFKCFDSTVPLSLVLVVPFVLQTVGAVALVGYLSYRSGQQAVTILAYQLLRQTSERVCDRLSSYLDAPQKVVVANALAVQQGTLNLADREQLRRQLWQQSLVDPALPTNNFWSDRGPSLGYLRIATESSQVTARQLTGKTLPLGTLIGSDSSESRRRAYQLDGLGRFQQLIYESNQDFRQLPWYRQAKTRRRHYWTPVFITAITAKLNTMAVAPVFAPDGTFQGTFTSSYSLPDFSAFLNQLQFSPNGQVFLLERSGDLIATSVQTEAEAMRQVNGKPERLPAIASQDPLTRRVARYLLEQFGELQNIQSTQQQNLVVDGERKFVQITPYRDAKGLDWLLVVVVPEADFMTEIQDNQTQTFWLCGLTLVAVTSVGLLTARLITRPILRLSRASADLAQGKWSDLLPDSLPITEIQVLTRSFNQTAQQLRRAFERIAGALQASEASAETLLNSAIAALAQMRIFPDQTWQIDQVSSGCEMISGYSAQELTADNQLWNSRIYPADWEAIAPRLFADIAAGNSGTYEYRFFRKDDTLIWLSQTNNSYWDPVQQCWVVAVISVDISDRKLTEVALQENETRLHLALDASRAIAWERDLVTDEIFFTRTLEAETPRVMSYQQAMALVYLEDREPLEQSHREAIAQRTGFQIEHRLVLSDKPRDWRWLQVSAVVLTDATGNPTRMIGLSLDVTERKQTELELQQAKEAAEAANLAKTTFLANMSHELRTPLNVILGYTQLLSHDSSLMPEYQEYLSSVQRSGEHLLALINDVLDFAKIEAGRLTLNETRFDLSELVENLQEMFQLRATSKQLELVFELPPERPCWIVTDPNKLRQVLINLLHNGVKFTEQGSVTLRVELLEHPQVNQTQDVLLSIAVTDTGVGIAPEELETIFDAFSQANAGKRSTEGTGLGLAISRRFVELMGGQLQVRSQPGLGSTFSFWVPVQRGDSQADSPMVRDRQVVGLLPGQPRYRVLIVDDHASNRQVLAQILKPLALEVREASNGTEAIQEWQTWQPHLIWMDIRMAGMAGNEAVKMIRVLERSISPPADSTSPLSPIPIIALTAQTDQADRDRALAQGFTDFLTKPFRTGDIFERMAVHLGLRYQYADSPSPPLSPAAWRQSSTELQAAVLQVMPPTWVAALYQAALNCSADEVESLITQIPPSQAELIQSLKRYAHDYNFEMIMRLSKDFGDR